MPQSKKDLKIDQHIGQRLRHVRKKYQLSQASLAEMVGVSHQQIQQYESGATRVSASTLYSFSRILQVPVSYFFEGYQPETTDEGLSPVIIQQRERALSILLVEDSAADEMLAREALRNACTNVDIFAVHDGQEALDYLRGRHPMYSGNRPDIILLDLNLPRMDGATLLREIKRDNDLKAIPVVVLTNSLDTDQLLASYRDQASGYCVKSFDVDEFQEKLSKLVTYWSSMPLPSMQFRAAMATSPRIAS